MTLFLATQIIMNQGYRFADQVSVTEVDDEVVLLKLDTGSYYGLNSIGAKLVNGLQNQLTVHQICKDIASDYQIPYQNVNQDLSDLIEQLVAEQLLIVIEIE